MPKKHFSLRLLAGICIPLCLLLVAIFAVGTSHAAAPTTPIVTLNGQAVDLSQESAPVKLNGVDSTITVLDSTTLEVYTQDGQFDTTVSYGTNAGTQTTTQTVNGADVTIAINGFQVDITDAQGTGSGTPS